MNGFGAAFAALGGAFGDIFSRRLGGLALICIVLAFALTIGAAWAAFRYLLPLIPHAQGWLGWVYEGATLLGGAGVLVLSILLMPAISMFLGGLLFDVAAARVEKAGFPRAAKARPIPIGEGVWNGLRIAGPALALNLLSLPLLFVPVVNLVWFLGLNGFLMGREYATLAALRRMSFAEARSFRRRASIGVFVIGLVCSIVPFVAPLLGASAMTRFTLSRGARTDSAKAS